MKICKNCGTENLDDSIFCKKCGKKLDDDKLIEDEALENQESEKIVFENKEEKNFSSYLGDEENPKPNKKIFIGLLVLVIVLSLGLVYRQYSKAQKEEIARLTESAVTSQENDDYLEANKIYVDLYEKTKDENYQAKADEMSFYQANKEKLIAGDDAYKKEDYEKAIENYSSIDEGAEKIYKDAEAKINNIANTYADEIMAFINKKEYDQAISLAKKTLRILPDNEKIMELKDQADDLSIKALKDEGNKELEKQIADLQKKLDESKSSPTIVVNSPDSGAKNYGNSYNSPGAYLIGTWQTITSDSANVRSGPGKGYGAVSYLKKGDSVYIYDTYYESSDRTWCNIGKGWVSYNTMNGSGR